MRYFLAIAVALALATTASAQSLNGIVSDVSDGDTATIVTADGEYFEVRFYGVDTPETKNDYLGWAAQPFSAEAKAFAKAMIEGREVFVRLKGEETYGRHVGEIFVDGRSASRELAREGLAWWNKKYQGDDLDIARLAFAAKEAKKGLWADDDAVAPWTWRRTKGFTASAIDGLEPRLKSLREFQELNFQE